MGDGKLTLPAAHGDFFAAAPNNNPNILLQPAPAGPWTMTTRLTFDPNENYEQAGLLVYGDDANYVKADYVYAGGRGLEFLREENNVAAGFGGFVGHRRQADDRRHADHLRRDDAAGVLPLRGRGRGRRTASRRRWRACRTPKIGVYANDSNATVTSRNDAVFDFFRITAGLPDTTAPVTTAAVAPQPVNGWNTGNVMVTLSTEAGATTEYKVGNGAYQTYSGPIPVSDEGTTVVTYRSRDADGNLEAEKTVTVKIDKTAPTSSASPNGGTFTGPVQVELTGADAGSGVAKLEYKLDGGDWTTYASPVTISGNGPHTLEHRATDTAGNVGAVASATYTINGGGGAGAPTVQAFADPESGAAPLQVHFSAAGLDPDGGALEYEWTLGDGTVLDSEFDYTFTQPGSYTATVTVTDPEGKTASDDVTVTVEPRSNAAPTVTASADKPSGPAPHTVAFTATGSDDGPLGELEYRWEFGDGGVSLEQNPSHRYMTKGDYTATVTVTDAGGKTAAATVPITVTDPPGNRAPTVKAGAAPKSGTAPLSVLFSAAGTDPDGDALTYSWDYGDGSAAGSGAKVTHVYASGGTYTATVTARDPDGLTGTATVSIVVGNPPGNQAPTVQIAADPAGGAAPLAVRFSASGRDPDGDPIMYVWDFGDGGKAGGKSATHTYAQAGTYTAKVTVTDSKGASGSATVQVVVQPAGQAQVRGAQAELAMPGSVRAFTRRGLRVKVTCERTGAGRARLVVTRATARRLALRSRTVATRRLRCRAGRDVSVSLKPSRRTARRLAGAQTLRLTLRVAVRGTRAVSRQVTIR